MIAGVERILARSDVAAKPKEMGLPGLRLHPLKGDRAGYWAVKVSANWCVVFRFDGRDVRDVDLTDYHWETRGHADEEPAASGPLRAP